MPTTWAMYVGRLSLKGTWKGILEVSAFLVYYITVLCPSTSQIQITFRKSRVEWLLPQSESDSRGASLGGARGTQESERYLGHFFLPFSFFLFLQDVVAKSLCAVEEREQTGVSHGFKQREAAPLSA